jgi:hypothetical protein
MSLDDMRRRGDELRAVVCNYLPDEDLIEDYRGRFGPSKVYYLSPDRQESAAKVFRMLAPFKKDYECSSVSAVSTRTFGAVEARGSGACF